MPVLYFENKSDIHKSTISSQDSKAMLDVWSLCLEYTSTYVTVYELYCK